MQTNPDLRWTNISDDAHGVRLQAWDHGRGGFPVRAGRVLRHHGRWLAFPPGQGWAAACASSHSSAMEARQEVEDRYVPGCVDSLVSTCSANEIQLIRDALQHLAILTGQDVLDVNFASSEDVMCHLVAYEHITGISSIGVPSVELRMRRSCGRLDESPRVDEFRSHCIVRG